MREYIESKGYTVGCYSDEIDKLSKNAHKNLKRAIDFGDYTDVKVKGGYVEVCFVDNECDLVYLTTAEYKSRYGEEC